MGWEWIAPAATVVTAAVGFLFTKNMSERGQRHAGEIARQGREHAETLTQQGHEHAEAVARNAAKATLDLAREQRRAVAYVEILTSVNDMTDSIITITHSVQTADEHPDLPAQADQSVLHAKIAAFGSPEMRTIFAEWHGHVKRLEVISGTDSTSDTRLEGVGLRERLRAAADRLGEQINQELTA